MSKASHPNHNMPQSNKGKSRKCAKFDYVIEGGLMGMKLRLPGLQHLTVHCGKGGPWFEIRGEPHF